MDIEVYVGWPSFFTNPAFLHFILGYVFPKVITLSLDIRMIFKRKLIVSIKGRQI